MHRRILTAAAVALLLASCSSSSDDMPADASQGVVDRIEALDDCDQLQAEFDQADENGGEVGTFYMETADARMREAGCYDD